jgi:hypothetical protein
MRKVEKDQQLVPVSLTSEKAKESLLEICAAPQSKKCDRNIYRDPYKDRDGRTQSRVIDELNKYYHYKCAYCESLCKAEVEHYRPAKRVEEDRQDHPGYFWLCYTWSNLLPSCHDCNTSGGKHNRFPIKANRISSPPFLPDKVNIDHDQCKASESPLINEMPYLLNPEIDNPEKFLAFKISDRKNGIKIIGIDEGNRGGMTVEICNLNRMDLLLRRLTSVYDPLKKEITRVFMLAVKNIIPLDNILIELKEIFKIAKAEADKDQPEYTLLRKFLIASPENFESYFAPYLEEPQREITVAAFRYYFST